jgi:hypothetical protein
MHLGHRRRRFNITTGAVLDTIIVENNQAYPSTVYDSEDLRSRFYMELLKTTLSYDSLFGLGGGREGGAAATGLDSLVVDLAVAPPVAEVTDRQPMVVGASDARAQRIIDQAKHSIIREWIVRPDIVYGRYGVPPDQYGTSESDGFQENVNSGATAAIAWGFFGTARGILSSYWRFIVRNDGGIKYRGAMMPGYGRMLTVLAQYISATNDTSIITEEPDVSRHVDAVVQMLEAKVAAAKLLPSSHIAHGLPMGCDEADACYEYSTYTGTLAELPYFSSASK